MAESLFHQQLGRQGFVDSVAENSGRHAISYGSFTTTGSGEIVNPDPLQFNVPFVHMPAVAYSYYVDDEDLIDTRWPRCWGGVLGWETTNSDDCDLYVAATAFVIVETTTFEQVTDNTDEINYTIRHFFTFNGVALKFVTTDFASMQIKD
jgi:hypothetical protein